MEIVSLNELSEKQFESFDISSLIGQANFDYINPDVRNFGTKKVNLGEFYLVHFGEPSYTEEVESVLGTEKLMPANVCDLLAFSIVYPDLQRTFPIVAIGSCWENKPGNKLVAALWGGEKSRELNMCSISTKWVGEDRFLVFRGKVA